MISRVRGRLTEVSDSSVTIEVAGVGYSIFVSASLARELMGRRGEEVELCTYHYLQGAGMGGGLPTLIGFRSLLDREFFEQFITVSGIGPKAAVRALTLPVAEIAAAIEAADHRVLESLPGIGRQRANQIIAKLQGKVSKFAMAPAGAPVSAPVKEDIAEEARLILTEQLKYSTADADRMIQNAFARRPTTKTVEELLRDIYRERVERGPEREA
jgi:Holliday junction DNA helicase RuvA